MEEIILKLELSNTELEDILDVIKREIRSDVEFLATDSQAYHPAGECFQTFLWKINKLSDIYLKLFAIYNGVSDDDE